MKEKNILLIINPKASKGKGRKRAEALISYFSKRCSSFNIEYTDGKGHAKKLAYEGAKKGFSTIVAVGGDGTVNEVVNGIMSSGCQDRVIMGIIPVGRGNDFAWVCGIPRNTYKAADLVLTGKAKKTDVGVCYDENHIDGMYFINGSGFGFEPMVNFKAMEYKHFNGMPSYIIAFFSILRNPPLGYSVTMKIDGDERVLTTQQISVANGIRMGSAFKMTPLAKIDDGMFDVMFTNKVFLGPQLISLVISFFRGIHVKDKQNFSYLRARNVQITSDKNNMPVHLDGELFSKNAKDVSIHMLPGAINLLR